MRELKLFESQNSKSYLQNDVWGRLCSKSKNNEQWQKVRWGKGDYTVYA